MFPLAPFTAVLLCLVVFTGAMTDLRERRIPNWLTGGAVLTGWALHWFLYGWPGLQHSLLGMAAGLAVYLPLFLLRGMGGGDVKMMAAAGALAGPKDWFGILILTAICGGAAALVVVLQRGMMGRAVRNIIWILSKLVRGRAPHEGNAAVDVDSGEGLSLPHGVAIAFGTFLHVLIVMR